MNTATVSQSTSITRGQLLAAEKTAFSRIPGMDKLRSATPDTIAALKNKYPDAAFALMISENLFTGDQEQNEIHQRAYKAILNGEPMTGIRFRYDYDLEAYLLKHMWD